MSLRGPASLCGGQNDFEAVLEGRGSPWTSARALSLEQSLPDHLKELGSTQLALNSLGSVGSPSMTGSSGLICVRKHSCHVLAQPPQFTDLGLSLAQYSFTKCLLALLHKPG